MRTFSENNHLRFPPRPVARLSHRKYPILFIREFILGNYPTNVFIAVEDLDTT